ncbi:MAG: response regulator transcription factor [Desulfuromonadaceae bacterium]|nr:response regulator transcription factor [Desulfuromonadaceae bacterium]
MKILIAEDDTPSRLMLQSLLAKWGYTVISASDGDEAWKILCEPEHPHLVILDWKMPGIEGPEIVNRLRAREPEKPYYAIVITSRSNKDSAASALNSGADDFIGKPFDNDELRARVAVGYRMNSLQKALFGHIQDLRQALDRVNRLEGIIPICMYCKKIRDDQNSWNQLEKYISEHSEAMFSHGICPECAEKQMKIIELI